jgi:hypothetical protein
VVFSLLDLGEALLFASQTYSEAANTGAWILVQVGFIGATVLISLGLVGLYAYQAENAGTLGLIGFVTLFTGTVLAAGSAWSEAFFGAWLAEASPELLDGDPAGVLVAGALLTLGLFALGGLLFGLASLRAGALPRGASVLLMIGALLYPLLGLLEVPFVGVLFGVAVAWLGYALWSATAAEGSRLAEAAT